MITFELAEKTLDSIQVDELQQIISKDKEIKHVVLRSLDFEKPQNLEELIDCILAQRNICSIILQGLHLSGLLWKKIWQVGTHLEEIKLDFISLGDDACQVQSTFFNNTLKSLTISNITASTRLQRDVMLTNMAFFTGLTSLNLSAFHFGSSTYRFTNIIEKLPLLTSLNISATVLDEAYLSGLEKALVTHQCLKKLDCDAAVNQDYSNLPKSFLAHVNEALLRNDNLINFATTSYSLFNSSEFIPTNTTTATLRCTPI